MECASYIYNASSRAKRANDSVFFLDERCDETLLIFQENYRTIEIESRSSLFDTRKTIAVIKSGINSRRINSRSIIPRAMWILKLF